MDYNYENGVMTLAPRGKVDSNNAAEVENAIFELLNAHQPSSVVISAEHLTYISSAGLRVLLNVKKKYTDTMVVNVSVGVYEIFRTTGFADIMEIKKAMREISVEGCEKIGEGSHSDVYRIAGDTIVKVYKPSEPASAIEREIRDTRTAFVMGIPTAIPFDVVKCGDSYGAVFEMIDSDTLSHALSARPEMLDEYSKKYISLIQAFHTADVQGAQMTDTKSLYQQWIDGMKPFLTSEEATLMHDIIESVPDRDTIVHGDIHPGNVMVQDAELVIIDMGEVTHGHPVFDYAGMALTHVLAGADNPKITKQLLGVEYPTALKLWNDLLQADYGDRPARELERIKDVVMGFGWLKYVLLPSIDKSSGVTDSPEMILQTARARFFPTAKRLVGAVDF